MRIFIALFLLVALASANLTTPHMRNIINGAKAVNDVMEMLMTELHAERDFSLGNYKEEAVPAKRQTTAACDAAFTAYRAAVVGSTCLQQASTAVNDATADAARIAATNGFCTAPAGGENCVTKFTTVVRNLARDCPRVRVLTAEVKETIWLMNFICTKDDAGTNCVPSFWSSVKRLQAETSATNPDWTKATNNFLTSLCTPCTLKILRRLAIYASARDPSGRSVAAIATLGKTIAVMCTRWPPKTGEFCVTRFVSLSSDLTTTTGTPAEQVRKIIATLCHPCTKAFVLRMAALFEGTDVVVAALNALGGTACSKGDDGEYCLVKYYNTAGSTNPAANCPDISVPITGDCPAGCVSDLQSLASNFGCCSRIVVDVVSQGDLQKRRAIISNIKDKCGVDLPARCAGSRGLIRASVVISNLRQSEWNARRLAILAAIRKDLASAAVAENVDIENENPTFDTTNNSVTVEANVATGTSGDAVDASNEGTVEGGFVNTQQAAGVDSTEDPTMPLDTRATATILDRGVASSSTYSLGLLVLLALVALLF